MTSRASKGSSGSSASSSRVNTQKHESSFSHFKADLSADIKKLAGSFHKDGDIRKAPLPPTSTPKNKIPVTVATNTAEHKPNIIARGIYDVKSRLTDIKNEITGGKKVEAATDMLLLPTHMIEDQVWKPVADKAVHVVEQAGPAVLKATVGPLVLGGVVVIAAAIFIFVSYKELNHVVDHALS
jgi:hypothetical protein